MSEEELKARILHLRQVEKLSHRQIASVLNIGRERVGQILGNLGCAKIMPKESVVDKYAGLIAQWYQQYPKLQGKQIYERLQSYGYKGSYVTIARMTLRYRRSKQKAYHSLTFLPGEEAQVDWFFFRHERLGYVAGFVYVLSYSRYAWGSFIPRHHLNFFYPAIWNVLNTLAAWPIVIGMTISKVWSSNESHRLNITRSF